MISTEEFIPSEVPYLQTEIKLNGVELQVLKLTSEDKSADEIAEIVFRSHRTVETIRIHLKLKLGAQTLAGMVATAFQVGILEIPKEYHQHIIWQVRA